ncbi:MAG: hypothetical protein COV66_01880 [Nitrospinae bacterium CG11_big_fil_rev_8_21_14_0_20_45_15]|nr:MAG: hypothetical protein COV66_01880 [Nitrospinae bacterium CG11_big_fil_rev_8_21_14_0_20_45_15]
MTPPQNSQPKLIKQYFLLKLKIFFMKILTTPIQMFLTSVLFLRVRFQYNFQFLNNPNLKVREDQLLL